MEYFISLVTELNAKGLILCITKTGETVPQAKEVKAQLEKIKTELDSNKKIFDEVLYTSARDNRFKFCQPGKYETTAEQPIYDATNNKKPILAQKLYELCTGNKWESPDEACGANTDGSSNGHN